MKHFGFACPPHRRACGGCQVHIGEINIPQCLQKVYRKSLLVPINLLDLVKIWHIFCFQFSIFI